MHYQKNLSFFSLGQGGYFSPQEYGLASIPISWFSRHQRFEYEIRASLGAQYFSQDRSPFFPTRINAALPAQGFFASNHSAGPNYNFLARLGHRLSPGKRVLRTGFAAMSSAISAALENSAPLRG